MQRPYNSLRLPDRRKPNLLRQITAAPNNINRDEELEKQVYGNLLNKRQDFSNPMRIIESTQRGAEEGGLLGGIGGAVQGVGQFAASPMGKRLIAAGISGESPELARYIASMADEEDKRGFQEEEIRKQSLQRMYEFKARGRQEALGEAQAQKQADIKGEIAAEKYEQERADKVFTQTTTLRKQFDDITREFRVMRDYYNTAISVSKDPSPVSDIALIFSYMKIIDPPSTVMRGEQADAKNAGNIPQRIRGVYNKLLTGKGAMSASVRADFLQKIRVMYNTRLKERDLYIKQYKGLAKEAGIPFSAIEFYPAKIDAAKPKPEPDSRRFSPAGNGIREFDI